MESNVENNSSCSTVLRDLENSFNQLEITNLKTQNLQIFDKNTINKCPDSIKIDFCRNYDKKKLEKILKVYKDSVKTCSNNTLSSRVHPFRSFEELKGLTQTENFANNNIKILGCYKFTKFNSHDLEKCHILEGKSRDKIVLNMRFQHSFPSTGSNILVFGCLSFKEVEVFKRISIDVKFWKYLPNIENYARSLSNQNILRPEKFDLKMELANFNETNFDVTLEDNLFDTIDTSLFLKSLEENESLFYEVEKIMAIEIDLFK